MSWGRTENPKKVYKIGDSVKCFIKEINGDKIALSVKYPDQNPWNDASTKYAVGNVVTGKVARMTDLVHLYSLKMVLMLYFMYHRFQENTSTSQKMY